MQNSIETRGNLCTELGAPVFQAISNLINGKKSVVERPKRGGLSLPGNSYKNLHNPCMYLVDILKFPKKVTANVTIKIKFLAIIFVLGSTGV